MADMSYVPISSTAICSVPCLFMRLLGAACSTFFRHAAELAATNVTNLVVGSVTWLV